MGRVAFFFFSVPGQELIQLVACSPCSAGLVASVGFRRLLLRLSSRTFFNFEIISLTLNSSLQLCVML